MKKLVFAVVALSLLAALPAFAGNGALSGNHYNLNIIGSTDKNAPMNSSNRHTIFVKLWGANTKILLTAGEFKVLDGNGTDGTAAFQLPPSNVDCAVDAPADDPCQLDGDYAVFARALGAPGGYADMTTCADDAGTILCSTETIRIERTSGKPRFTNVTKELTTLCLDTDFINEPVRCDVRTQLFSNQFYTYFWDYDNYGLRLAQLRFYDLP